MTFLQWVARYPGMAVIMLWIVCETAKSITRMILHHDRRSH